MANQDQFEVQWKTPISSGPYITGMNPVLFDSLVIMSTEDNLHGKQAPILFIDSANGSVIDTWDDYIDGSTWYWTDKYYQEGDYLMLQTMHSNDCLNLKTRQRQWASTTNQSQSAFVYGNAGYVYTSHHIGTKTAKVLRSPIDQKNWQTIYTFTANGKMSPFFDGFGFGELPNGDEIVLWQNRSGSPLDRVEIFAYNISADTLLWRNRDFIGFDTPFSPKVFNGKVYGRFIGSVYCLDIETGETIWIKDLEPSFEHSFLPFGVVYLDYYHNQLIVHANRDKLLYLNPDNGNIKSSFDGYPDGSGEGDFSEYQGKLYFTSSYQLVVTDILSGENLASPAKLGVLNDIDIRSSITIDPASGKLYFQDGYYLYCVKQPKNL